MNLTPYHAKYFAHELTRRYPSDSADKLAGALVDAQVDLNPHQIDAALFAFQSPLSKGAILADEVGLGKTIEAGLIISQKWAERKRRVLIITPSHLRKQWHQELTEKFFLPCRILEKKSFNEAVKAGDLSPFRAAEIVICSYQFARIKATDIHAVAWDLVVIDEAHRLRNVYKPANIIARTLKDALQDAPKLLLTATPLQNSLLELFGLVSFIDGRIFGDLVSYKEQFAELGERHIFNALKARLKPVCQRTLRRQVLPYVRFTQRLPILQPFTPEDNEDRLYELVSEYLQRDNLQALPSSQRSLITLVLRKLLASSSFAIAGALDSMITRLQVKLGKSKGPEFGDQIESDYEAFSETAEEWTEDGPADALDAEDRAAIQKEIAELIMFRDLAISIRHNAKGIALLKALDIAFKKARELGAAEKAIIFTESRRTQSYLVRVLSDTPWKDDLVLFNGSNDDEKSREIYRKWLDRHQGTDRVTGSRTADIRSALIDYFREQGRIFISTEAGAEGINLQFCSLVVNYDLPWNPQRIEQRIGRSHRYGQKHDVVVVNFLNSKNEADQRVFQLLSEKFRLFEGVFGASDDVLGAVESGVDFEKRIVDIYQHCRKPEDINAAFDRLQEELSAQIDEAMTLTRLRLLENFDDEVREKLRDRDVDSKASLGRYERMLMQLTRHELDGRSEFLDDSSFRLTEKPFPGDFPLGLYELPRRSGEAHLYRLNHPLALAVLNQAKVRPLEKAEVAFDLTGHDGKISSLDPYLTRSGWLAVSVLSVAALEQEEDYLIFSGTTDEGEILDEDAVRRMFSLSGKTGQSVVAEPPAAISARARNRISAIQEDISKRNAAFFEAEADKLDRWAEDLKIGLEREIKDLDREIREARRASFAAISLEDKLTEQRKIKTLETQRNAKRRALFDAQDDIDRQRERLIADIERKLKQTASHFELFTIKWHIH
jgi:adenine-specific DNA-methyltransferase